MMKEKKLNKASGWSLVATYWVSNMACIWHILSIFGKELIISLLAKGEKMSH